MYIEDFEGKLHAATTKTRSSGRTFCGATVARECEEKGRFLCSACLAEIDRKFGKGIPLKKLPIMQIKQPKPVKPLAGQLSFLTPVDRYE